MIYMLEYNYDDFIKIHKDKSYQNILKYKNIKSNELPDAFTDDLFIQDYYEDYEKHLIDYDLDMEQAFLKHYIDTVPSEIIDYYLDKYPQHKNRILTFLATYSSWIMYKEELCEFIEFIKLKYEIKYVLLLIANRNTKNIINKYKSNIPNIPKNIIKYQIMAFL